MKNKVLIAIIFGVLFASVSFLATKASADYRSFASFLNGGYSMQPNGDIYIPHSVCTDHGGETINFNLEQGTARMGSYLGWGTVEHVVLIYTYERANAVPYWGMFSERVFGRFGSKIWTTHGRTACVFFHE